MSEEHEMHFYMRHDCDKLLLSDFTAKIIKKFEHGFDIFINDKIVFFTSDELSLHALSYLVPAFVVETASESDLVEIVGDKMTVSQQVLGWGGFIGRDLYVLKTDHFVFKKNIELLRKTLKLFGKPSIIKEAILGKTPCESIFYKQEFFLRSCEFDSSDVMNYIGAGEGLTPSFDDYLSGALYVDRVLNINRIKLSDEFFEIIKSKTTIQSVQQLFYANKGKLSLRFETFVSDFLVYPTSAAQITSLLSYGNTSGTDILCGILAYLESL